MLLKWPDPLASLRRNKKYFKPSFHCVISGYRTDILKALNLVQREVFTRSHGDRQGHDNIVILITDAHDQQIKSQYNMPNTRVFTVALNNDYDKNTFRNIASYPENIHALSLPNDEAVSRVADHILNQICNS